MTIARRNTAAVAGTVPCSWSWSRKCRCQSSGRVKVKVWLMGCTPIDETGGYRPRVWQNRAVTSVAYSADKDLRIAAVMQVMLASSKFCRYHCIRLPWLHQHGLAPG